MYVELIGVVQGRLFHSPTFISNLLWGAFRYPTGIDVCCYTSFFTMFVTAWVLKMNQIAHSKATFSKNLLSFFGLLKVCLSRPFMCLDFFFFFLIQEIKIAEKKIKFTCPFKLQTTADSQQSAANQPRVFDVICNALWVKQRIFPIWEKYKRIAIQEQFDKLWLRTEILTYWLFG